MTQNNLEITNQKQENSNGKTIRNNSILYILNPIWYLSMLKGKYWN